jgi:hypothetical protein
MARRRRRPARAPPPPHLRPNQQRRPTMRPLRQTHARKRHRPPTRTRRSRLTPRGPTPRTAPTNRRPPQHRQRASATKRPPGSGTHPHLPHGQATTQQPSANSPPHADPAQPTPRHRAQHTPGHHTPDSTQSSHDTQGAKACPVVRPDAVPLPAGPSQPHNPGRAETGTDLAKPLPHTTAHQRTTSSGTRASFPQTTATPGTPSSPTSASCTPVCSQSAWSSSDSATAGAMSFTAATVPRPGQGLCRLPGHRRVLDVQEQPPASTSAASGASAKEARSRPGTNTLRPGGRRRLSQGRLQPSRHLRHDRTVPHPTKKIEPRQKLPTCLTQNMEAPPGHRQAPQRAVCESLSGSAVT